MLQVVVLLITKLIITGRDIAKRRKLSILELTFKSLNDTNFPEYLRLSTLNAVSLYNLRSSVTPLSRHCRDFFQQSTIPCHKDKDNLYLNTSHQ